MGYIGGAVIRFILCVLAIMIVPGKANSYELIGLVVITLVPINEFIGLKFNDPGEPVGKITEADDVSFFILAGLAMIVLISILLIFT